jgi:hypothetical protein
MSVVNCEPRASRTRATCSCNKDIIQLPTEHVASFPPPPDHLPTTGTAETPSHVRLQPQGRGGERDTTQGWHSTCLTATQTQHRNGKAAFILRSGDPHPPPLARTRNGASHHETHSSSRLCVSLLCCGHCTRHSFRVPRRRSVHLHIRGSYPLPHCSHSHSPICDRSCQESSSKMTLRLFPPRLDR